MLNKRLCMRIDDLNKEIENLSRRIWLLENPPKFKIGDKVVDRYEGIYFKSVPTPCEIVGINPSPTSAIREYFVKYDTDNVYSVSESELKPNN